MKRCETCKFWIKSDDLESTSLGRCSQAIQFWNATEWGDEEVGYQRILKPEYIDNLLFVQDASDYSARLITRPNFGCVLHEEDNGV